VSERQGPLLSVSDLTKSYLLRSGWRRRKKAIQAVDGVSFDVHPRETWGIVGESGCGKSTLLRCVVQLERASSGTVAYSGSTLTGEHDATLREFRRSVQMVFQDPYSSLDPRMRVDEIIAEPLRVHGIGRDIHSQVLAALSSVGLGADAADKYPHEFSGGQRQRISIARSLVLSPELLVLDEPVSALDVSVRAGVLNTLLDLQVERSLAYVMVAHDLTIVFAVCQRVAVMYAGSFVEVGPARAIFERPSHPYTATLLAAVPVLGATAASHRDRPPPAEPAVVDADVPGCRFRARCQLFRDELTATERQRCVDERPTLMPAGDGSHASACHFREATAARAGAPARAASVPEA
jgi:peptide/nickel transport system ATP-binding protein/oligopeptide transport system ATP-binding protein